MKTFLYHLTFVAALTSSLAVAQSMPQRQNPANIPPPSQQQPPTSDQQPPASDQARTAANSADVQNDIQSALQKEPSLANANISVQVSGQNVELSGTVPTKQDKARAEQIAKAHSGGLSVKNHIKVAAKSSSSPGDNDK